MAEGAFACIAVNETMATSELTAHRDRALALEIRAGRFGFAIFEAFELVDWGTYSHPEQSADKSNSAAKFVSLLVLSMPSVVITRYPRKSLHESSRRARFMWHKIVSVANRRAIPVVVVKRREAKRYFAANGCRSKDDVARWLVTRFPPLAWRLPQKRKLWQREAHSVVIFDAVATAVASGLLSTA